MRLSRIEIENFKGIAAKQVIDLAPITLLFGANSAGKSTILQALHYLREVLSRANPDPDQTLAGGLIDLGGFANLIHANDLNRTMTIKIVIDGVDGFGADHLPLNAGGSLTAPEFEQLPIRYLLGENTDLKDYAVVQSVGVSVSVAWSELNAQPYVSSITVQLDNKDVATISSPPQSGRAILSDINFEHDLFHRIVDQIEPDEPDEGLSKHPLADEVAELSREMADSDAVPESSYRVSIKTVKGALPDLNSTLTSDLRDPDVSKVEFERASPRVRGLENLLDELVAGPMRVARDYLNETTYIGPLREIPSRGFQPKLSPDEARWAQGLAAWDLLYSDRKGDLLKRVNFWLSGKDRLGTNYEILRTERRDIPTTSRMHQLFARGITEDDLSELQEAYTDLHPTNEIVLRDFAQNITVSPVDVGVGVSQMIPVVVACLKKNPGVVMVEQPELHIHPAIQVGLGDLFLSATSADLNSMSDGKTLLIETHSEHIMLRLLRRVRETSNNQLPPGAMSAQAKDIAVIYVENSDQTVEFKRMKVDSDGDFSDRWPRGFFRERAKELF
ncbi:AAA family ATPase [Parasedimentitalea huanghaiensis]|uniref:AAA family ATPase n=1 Tax=Parasedimentitalea huanghaiensis TaxID=2682100 RepID=A0A6L6WL54_9RHOB|nr:AAA family ATPase [Zongyanglinia huanghaiensis]MVO18586.1 AAA family ATPase [Zongyanglinia huanghaiensis]